MELPVTVYTEREMRAVIRFLAVRGETSVRITAMVQETYGEHCMHESSIRRWAKRFREGRTNIEDEARSGRPRDSVNEDNIKRVKQLLKEDSRLTLTEMAERMPIECGRSSIRVILHDVLGYRKLSARWIPRLLTDDHKRQRMGAALQFLTFYNEVGPELLLCVVTGDETWAHYYTPEQKRQSKQWCAPGEPPPKKVKSELSAGKLMVTVFWDCRGPLLIRYMPRGSTINAAAYCDILRDLRRAIRRKRPELNPENVYFLHDNARPHTARITQELLQKFGWTIGTHPPYSPDVAPSDFHLFPALKSHLGGQRFANDDDVKNAIGQFFRLQSREWYYWGLERLVSRYDKCLTRGGDYVEK